MGWHGSVVTGGLGDVGKGKGRKGVGNYYTYS